MQPLNFYKMSGSGNDFIIIDNRKKVVNDADLVKFIASVCRRKMSVGADGFILVENSDDVDFEWRFYNSDGSVAEMCGNGARCAARFAYENNIAGPRMSFKTEAGVIHAQIIDDRVKIKMPDPTDFKKNDELHLEEGALPIASIHTGVPHVVIVVDDIEEAAVVELGRKIRFHETFAPAGTNVNFINPMADNVVAMRTYERGVEDETLACGTGAVASAIVMADKLNVTSPVSILTRSGERLSIYYAVEKGIYSDIYLEGDARIIYKARLCEDAWK
ncbi:MAG: diaminopimelate epimerase [Desulfobacterales bacterium]|nr:MAG: diaminopimelate epimerase [Desulfobacterales bacterium]